MHPLIIINKITTMEERIRERLNESKNTEIKDLNVFLASYHYGIYRIVYIFDGKRVTFTFVCECEEAKLYLKFLRGEFIDESEEEEIEDFLVSLGETLIDNNFEDYEYYE